MVVVYATSYRRHRSAVAHPTGIVCTFNRSLCAAFGKTSQIRRNLIDHPVDERCRPRRVRVIADERELPGSFGRAAPLQRRGYVLALSRILFGNSAARVKSRTRYLNFHP